MNGNAFSSSTFTNSGDAAHVATEAFDVLVQPFECNDLIMKPVIFWYQISRVIRVQKTERTESVVDADEYNRCIASDSMVY